MCNGKVAIRRSTAGKVQLEGTVCDDYYKIRSLLYSLYAIIWFLSVGVRILIIVCVWQFLWDRDKTLPFSVSALTGKIYLLDANKTVSIILSSFYTSIVPRLIHHARSNTTRFTPRYKAQLHIDMKQYKTASSSCLAVPDLDLILRWGLRRQTVQ